MKTDKNLEILKELLDEIKNMSNEEFITDYKRLEKKVEGRIGRIVLKEEFTNHKKQSLTFDSQPFISYIKSINTKMEITSKNTFSLSLYDEKISQKIQGDFDLSKEKNIDLSEQKVA